MNYKASRYRYVFIFFSFFLTAGRSIRHSGGCDGERVKQKECEQNLVSACIRRQLAWTAQTNTRLGSTLESST